ncbi:aromatic acid exporter family protein [uncultured Oscillibacter sp.]|uniref:FUSC family protein n=1 Tax=uncultured Oscillibacter sp. TaxID=876091 RepID=UPI0025F0DC96|nr:aromatic acid exporter family protein [uncultured Oscillibacter sp.]
MSQTGQFPRRLPKIGMRNIKTALAAALCAFIYYFLDRSPAFACIGAIFGMGSDLENSKLHGGNRLFGTAIGGLLGMALFRIYLIFYPEGGHTLLLVPLVFIGTVALILLCQIFWVGGVQPGGVVLCIILFNTPVESYITYALNRIFDTGIGVIMALVVNSVFPGGFTFRFMERFYRLFRKAEEPPNINEKTEDERDGISN